MDLINKVREDLKKASKEQNKERQAALRMLLAALETEEKREGEFDKPKAIAVVKGEINKRKEAIEAYQKADAQERVEGEKKELEIISEYLPEQAGEEEIRKVAEEVIEQQGVKSKIENPGPIIGQVMGRIGKEKVDGGLVAKVVREMLQQEND